MTTMTAERGSGNETEGRGMMYKYRHGARYKDFNKVRGDVVREMTAIKKEDDADVVEKTSRKLGVTSPVLQQNCIWGIRHLQVLLLFLGMTIGYSLRVAMSVAVVSMANANTTNPDIRDYNWTKQEKDLVLSSFFWGYVVTQVPSGYIANIWSGQKVLAIGMLLCGVFKVITPFVADWGLAAVLVCRVGMGLTQAALMPCTQTLLSKWVPPAERARLGTFAYAGGQFGTVITMPIAGSLATSSVGWPSVFYVFGVLAIIWGVAFLYFGADAPSTYRNISQEERMYIEESLRIETKSDNEVKQKMKTPWKEIFTSVPMWALIIVHCAQNWGYWTLLTEIPSYMTGVLNFPVDKGGIISALPYLVMWILSFPMSWLSDYALKKGASRAIVRKISNTIAHWGPAIAMACMSAVPEDGCVWAIVILTLAVGLNAGSMCGFQINHIDLSPNFAGTMMSITNCFATVTSIIAPLICGVIVSDESSAYQWNIVFYVAAVIYFLGNLVFMIFGKAEVQWWNEPEAWKQKRRGDEENETQT